MELAKRRENKLTDPQLRADLLRRAVAGESYRSLAAWLLSARGIKVHYSAVYRAIERPSKKALWLREQQRVRAPREGIEASELDELAFLLLHVRREVRAAQRSGNWRRYHSAMRIHLAVLRSAAKLSPLGSLT